ncbi:hypothetical protein SAMN04487913_111167 [Arthrobacter sp. ok362]|nr:hypothetical protein SAMN04487913_111167 [Arthrobacter sp. ok362]
MLDPHARSDGTSPNVGRFGAAILDTPALDGAVRNGVLLETYSNSPVCSPSCAMDRQPSGGAKNVAALRVLPIEQEQTCL